MATTIENKTWKTWLGAMKAIAKAGLSDTYEAIDNYPNGGIVARPINTSKEN